MSAIVDEEKFDGAAFTAWAIQKQVTAMGSELFELGLYKPDGASAGPAMMIRIWDAKTILKSVPWLRYQNRGGRNIYIRPKGEHNLTMVDDLPWYEIMSMKASGFGPAVVVETSPGNYQVWLKHPERLDKAVSTAAARALAEKFGADRGAADWRHFGRLAGLTNRKAKYCDVATGQYPFVNLIEATGRGYSEAERFLMGVKNDVAQRRAELEQWRQRAKAATIHPPELKSIVGFRADARYGGDGTRVDLAYAVYALSHGASAAEVNKAIRSRDLSHKGNESRQDDYVQRTLKKALAAIGRGR